MGFRFPTPLLGAAAAGVFLFLEENPIWGGTLASTLTGEFSYSYGVALGVLFLGVAYRAYARGDPPWRPALLLALTALAHGYAVLWAGLAATYFLYGARRPARTLGWLAGVAVLAFALAAFWLVPLLADWRWTTRVRRPVDHASAAEPGAALPAAAGGARRLRPAAHAAAGPPQRRARPAAAVPAARRPGGGGAGGGGARVRGDRRALRAHGAARRLPGRSGEPGRAAGGSRARRRCWRWRCWPWACCTATCSRMCCVTGPTWNYSGPGGEAALAGLRRARPAGCAGRWATRAWPSSTAPSTRRRARSASTRCCRSSRGAQRSRASTTRPAC